MNFQAGDVVMHWTHGLGKIIRLEKRDLFGRQALYYAVRVGDMTVWVPADEKLRIRLRPPTSKAQFRRLLATLSEPAQALPADRHERKLLLVDLLKDGRAESLCRVISGLAAYRHVHSLNDNDQAMLRRVQSALLAEWGHVLAVTPAQAEVQLHRLLDTAAA